MRSRREWFWGVLPASREPIRISHCFRVVVGITGPNSGNWSPEIVGVFGVVKGDHVIGKTQIKQSKQPCILPRRQAVRQLYRLCDLVPIVLYGPIPEPPGQCLIGRGRRAVGDSKGLDLVESIAIRIAGQSRRRAGWSAE